MRPYDLQRNSEWWKLNDETCTAIKSDGEDCDVILREADTLIYKKLDLHLEFIVTKRLEWLKQKTPEKQNEI
eukprot:CAMPEP_0185573538 /NCGR_PEP_ID=MMETSP0434-20130131/5213_1 /TAXON_ID=626734 ORGANISM="Favella taraikaensis, Strain Fe Narragansett Bay" /NCGR_SAMPLE_ID=MMETSP0434 /ASSEMBLY_ACC=CAM_ASM_000379 /LENGTH=71 /DNA_ID=CAMNT_0028189789 /DNA_START=2046 /DNA_END=2261 /DNA_ORIENTATION=+